ncbi:hypothetical protein GCM10023107_91640 [Actinoplanes octamycinicus]|nr:hypothetical protein Aoc01nite_39000 [Actinoplanes octamycinicus]
MTATLDGTRRDGPRHTALVVESDTTIDDSLVPHLYRQIDAGRAVLVAVSSGTERRVRDRMGAAADMVQWVPSLTRSTRLGVAISHLASVMQDRHARRQPLYLVSEPDPTLDGTPVPDRLTALIGYEAAANDTVTEATCSRTCVWDARRYPAEIIDAIYETHDHELTPLGEVPNPRFVDPADYLIRRGQQPLTPLPAQVDLDTRLTSKNQLRLSRADLRAWAHSYGFDAPAHAQLVLACSEVISNGFRHGAPPVRVRAWARDHSLIVQVDDAGCRPIPGDAGYRSPVSVQDPMGLWVARQAADSVLTRTTTDATSVRLYFPLQLMGLPPTA